MDRRAFDQISLYFLTSLLFSLPANPETAPKKEKELPPLKYLLAKTSDPPVFFKPNLSSQFKPTYQIKSGAVICAEILPNTADFLRIHPDNGAYSVYEDKDNQPNVFIRSVDFQEITQFDPISVYPDTSNPEKQIVVFYNGYYPEAILLEGEKIVAFFPVGLGGSYRSSSTYPGDYHINSLRVSRYMNTLPGVPFVAYYHRGKGKAFHGAYWKNWLDIKQGYFGSAGCINVPCFMEKCPYNINLNDQEIGFDQFLFLWLRTVFPFDVYKQEEMEVKWDPKTWYSGEHTIRTIVCKFLEDLNLHPTHPQDKLGFSSWTNVIAGYNQLRMENAWLLPSFSNGQVVFRRAERLNEKT